MYGRSASCVRRAVVVVYREGKCVTGIDEFVRQDVEEPTRGRMFSLEQAAGSA